MLREVLKVLVPNSVVLGVVTLTQLEFALKLALLVLSIVYTLLKIREAVRKWKAES
jgi:hypothetical protein